MQRHIDRDRAVPIDARSEKTSIYMKDTNGMLVKVGKPQVKVKNLPGLPGFDK